MFKKILVAIFLLTGICASASNISYFPSSVAYAEDVVVYDEPRYTVIVKAVYPLGTNHFDTDIEFIFDYPTDITHYEFRLVREQWIFRTHRAANGPWRPVYQDKVAQAIWDYAYYNQ